MEITAKLIAELRSKTGIGMMECKKALVEADGDMDKAIEVMRKQGALKAAKKSERETNSGIVESYVHANGKIGVIVEILAETDFVAKNDEFKEFAHDVALHIAAMNPKYVSRDLVPAEVVDEEKKFVLPEIEKSGKPKEIQEKMLEGKISKFLDGMCLLDQPFVKNPDMKISDLLNEKILKIGEKIVISRFSRFEIGE